jgi:hypothetical protein
MPGRVLRVLLVGFAVISVVAHICALPELGHATSLDDRDRPATSHHHGAPDAGDAATPGDALHGASCEVAAARTASTYAPAPELTITRLPAVIDTLSTFTVVRRTPPASSFSPPPLFLLHASLLI